MVGEHSFKLTVRARVLELGHGAWRHEMGMEMEMESVFSSGYKGPCLSAAAAAKSNAADNSANCVEAECPRPRRARAMAVMIINRPVIPARLVRTDVPRPGPVVIVCLLAHPGTIEYAIPSPPGQVVIEEYQRQMPQ